MSLQNFIILWLFLNQWEFIGFCKQMLGGNLSGLAGMEIDFSM